VDEYRLPSVEAKRQAEAARIGRDRFALLAAVYARCVPQWLALRCRHSHVAPAHIHTYRPRLARPSTNLPPTCQRHRNYGVTKDRHPLQRPD